jgi:hypothetical protein
MAGEGDWRAHARGFHFSGYRGNYHLSMAKADDAVFIIPLVAAPRYLCA